MKLLPEIVHRFNSNAEKKIFRELRASSLKGVALHSINLPEHEYKQWAEADFVIISRYGLLVLEVKGGRVACRQGIWEYKNRFDEVYKSSEGPYMQAKSARVGLQTRLAGLIPQELLRKINFGFGVLFPDIIFDSDSLEIPVEAIYDARQYESGEMDSWLERLYSYWAEKTNKKEFLSVDEIQTLVDAIRPEFEFVPSLAVRVGNTQRKLDKLTEEQCRLLDIALAQKRAVIQGGAGTGKTFLAVETMRRLAASGKTVLFLCRSPVLAWIIQYQAADSSATVLNLAQADKLSKTANFIPFDVLIVDEGQDLLEDGLLSLMGNLLKGGLAEGNWYFFMDSNNQGSLYDDLNTGLVDWLLKKSTFLPLNYNCRNTEEIVLQTMVHTGGDIGKSLLNIPGLPVESFFYSHREELRDRLERLFTELIEHQGVMPCDISVLSFVSFEYSVISELDSRWRSSFHVIDSNFGALWKESMMTFSKVLDFKGLENKYIIFVDLEGFSAKKRDVSALYVGMTRASSYLFMGIPESIRPNLERLMVKNAKLIAKLKL